MLTFFDCFAGVGGFHLGVKAADPHAVCVGFAELEWDAQTTYVVNHEYDGPLIHDVTTADLGDIPPHDLLCGGFPCQSFSRAGPNSNGLIPADDERSQLYLYLAEILRRRQPPMFLFENVEPLLLARTTDARSFFAKAMRAFVECGYQIYCDVISPHDFGIPQQRYRLFMAGFLGGCSQFQFPPSEPRTCGIIDVLEDDVAPRFYLDRPLTHKPPHTYTNGLSLTGGKSQQNRIYSSWGYCPTITRMNSPRISLDHTAERRVRRLTPRETARLQGFPEWFVLPDSTTVAYGQMGNAVCVEVIRRIVGRMLSTLPTFLSGTPK